jgi:hypothetical protein
MLLSMFISLILARKFKGKVFVSLMTAVLILISVSSIGFPSVWGPWRGYTFWHLNLPAIPLSLPFYISIREVYHYTINLPSPHPPGYDVELFFLRSTIDGLGFYLINLTASYIILLVSFFLLINLVGAIFGYWISKTPFMDRYFARRKPETETT